VSALKANFLFGDRSLILLAVMLIVGDDISLSANALLHAPHKRRPLAD